MCTRVCSCEGLTPPKALKGGVTIVTPGVVDCVSDLSLLELKKTCSSYLLTDARPSQCYLMCIEKRRITSQIMLYDTWMQEHDQV